MASFLKIASGLSVNPLLIALQRNPQLWNEHQQRTQMYQHSEVSDIWVRYNDFKNFSGDMAEFNKEHDSVWYPSYHLLPQVRDIVFPLMAAVEGERLGGVLITKIPPGGSVKPHVDSGWHAGYYDKYLVQLQSAPGQAFCFDDGHFCSEPGDVYMFDNSVTHWVENNSNVDRISMIVCIRSMRKA